MVLGWQRSGRVGHRRGLFLLPGKRDGARRIAGIMESDGWLGVVAAALDQLAARLHPCVADRGIYASAVADLHHRCAGHRAARRPDRACHRPACRARRAAARWFAERDVRQPDRADRCCLADRRRELRRRQGVLDRFDRREPAAGPRPVALGRRAALRREGLQRTAGGPPYRVALLVPRRAEGAGASTQVALFVAPVMVFISLLLGHPMDFVFTGFEIGAVFIATLIVAVISRDGHSNWLEGLQLIGVYVIIALAAFFL